MVKNNSSLLKNKEFQYFIIATTILDLGKKLSWVALSWFVYQITGSALSVGIVISASTISPLIASIIAGGILDSYNRRNIIVIENIIRGVILSLIPILFWIDALDLWSIVLVVSINGMLSSFTNIGSRTILPSLVNKNQLESANAIVSMTSQFGYLIGPSIGGFSVALFGEPMTLFFNVLCFFIAAFLYSLIPTESYQSQNHKKTNVLSTDNRMRKFFFDTKEGMTFLLKFKPVLFIAFITFFFNLTYSPFETMLPIYVKDILLTGPESLGFMWTAFAIGAFLGSLLWVKIKRTFIYSYALGLIIILWGITPTFFVYFSNIYMIYTLMFIGGIVYAPYNIISPTIQQILIPNDKRGRVLGVIGLIGGLGFPIGVYFSGMLAEFLGASTIILGSGMLTIFLGICVIIHPSLRFSQMTDLDNIKENL
ncbi:hypothetical protein COK76_24500 [Bacillus cereus]|nr:hypothetical protein COK76_24500 [Bacillus cereus]